MPKHSVFNRLQQKASFVALLGACVFLVSYRAAHVHTQEISWDAFGYYLYLPATFIHADPLLDDASWVHEANETYELTGTVYQLTRNDAGEPMYFFLMGMALFYAPIFLIAHFLALLLGFPADGFSSPYQITMALGCMIYVILGLIYLRKVLLRYFSEGIAATTLLLVVFGTNYIEHLTTKNLETMSVLFMLCTMVIWHTIRWYDTSRQKHLFSLAVFAALMILVKPSEGLILWIPLLWGITGWSGVRSRLSFFWEKRTGIVLSIGIALLIGMPQLLYWYLKTGSPIFDSYINPGVGLDFLNPHLGDVLFSYRKGWLWYTPLIWFALIGSALVVRKHAAFALPLVAYVLTELWLVSSWSEWWYGGAFSCRPMIITYPMLALALAFLLKNLLAQRAWIRYAISTLIGLTVFLNLFKWWQFHEGIIDPYRMTKAYFWATFLDTEWNADHQSLLLVRRSFDGPPSFQYPELYKEKKQVDRPGEYVLSDEYWPVLRMPFEELTATDHAWLFFTFEAMPGQVSGGDEYYLVVTMEREEGSYGYTAYPIEWEVTKEWKEFEFRFLTPEPRSVNDQVVAYIWNRGQKTVAFRSFSVTSLERK